MVHEVFIAQDIFRMKRKPPRALTIAQPECPARIREHSDFVDGTHADAAMALLRKAVEMGMVRPQLFRMETVLDPLRGRDDFKLLMPDLAMPREPFAAPR
jgi:hypothetical protein